ncbi:MAG: SRPBCC family protein [Sinobacterium sp.]|nr:SRPBCC family protein [Sinobacterium sp.]
MSKKVKMYTCVKVDKNYASSAAKSYRASVEINATPEQIFEVFEDASAWPIWALPIKHVEWTSKKPYGLGTTRTVEMVGLVGSEEFIAWDYPKHMAFCFTDMSESLLESFAEDYVVTALENGRSQLQWTMAMTPRGYGVITMAIFSPLMQWGLKIMLNNFKKYTEQRFSSN